MKTVLLIGVVVSTLISTILVIYLVRRWIASRPVEGFTEDDDNDDNDDTPDEESNPNVLISLVGRLKRMSGFLMNGSNWVDRIQMAGLSPVELARRHIKSNTQTE